MRRGDGRWRRSGLLATVAGWTIVVVYVAGNLTGLPNDDFLQSLPLVVGFGAFPLLVNFRPRPVQDLIAGAEILRRSTS